MSSESDASAGGRPRHFVDHPGRTAGQAEIHARPIVPMEAPARMRRVAFHLGQEPRTGPRVSRPFTAWCREAGVPPPSETDRHHGYEVAGRRVTWERHAEFVTLTWVSGDRDPEAWPAGIGLEAYAGEPVIVAVRIDLTDTVTISEPALVGFDPPRLCYSRIESGRAEIATDFVADAMGFTRYEFACGALGSIRRGLLVRRLLEIETYRMMALLGLPLARHLSPAITDLEVRLAALMGKVGAAQNTTDNQAVLDELHALSVMAGQIGEEARYRFSATEAYGEILWQRLDRLGEIGKDEHNTLQRYLAHRVEPALATCQAMEKRQKALSGTLAQTTELLNTRIGVDLQSQNQILLNAISDTARSQYRLQTTVEGLSTIAISYYSLGILGYMLHGFEERFHFDKSLIVAGLAPIVVIGVWLTMRHIKKKHAR